MLIISPYVFPGLKDTRTLTKNHTAFEAAQMLCSIVRYDFVQLKEKSRKQNIVDKRCIIIKKLRDFGYPLQSIGDVFGLHHTTVIHSSTKAFETVMNNPDFADDVRDIETFVNCIRFDYDRQK